MKTFSINERLKLNKDTKSYSILPFFDIENNDIIYVIDFLYELNEGIIECIVTEFKKLKDYDTEEEHYTLFYKTDNNKVSGIDSFDLPDMTYKKSQIVLNEYYSRIFTTNKIIANKIINNPLLKKFQNIRKDIETAEFHYNWKLSNNLHKEMMDLFNKNIRERYEKIV